MVGRLQSKRADEDLCDGNLGEEVLRVGVGRNTVTIDNLV